jgi:2-amino-4-hydroxy-6-hydroxymethyldihydropteridine diphosphokinase
MTHRVINSVDNAVRHVVQHEQLNQPEGQQGSVDAMNPVYLSLGTNLGDRFANLQRAVEHLQKHLTVTAVSPVYATEAWGVTDQPSFLNACVAALTELSPRELLNVIKEIEREMGRTPTRHWGPRLIDIDIIFYSHQVVSEPDLTIPHPHVAERAFVLAPLADIIPNFVHPLTGESVQAMLDAVDMADVERLMELPFPSVAPLGY